MFVHDVRRLGVPAAVCFVLGSACASSPNESGSANDSSSRSAEVAPAQSFSAPFRLSEPAALGASRFQEVPGGFVATQPDGIARTMGEGRLTFGAGERRINVATRSIRRGDASISRVGGFRLSGGRIVSLFGANAREEIAPRGRGIEQSWRFDREPLGSGDLSVRVAISGREKTITRSADGIHTDGFVYRNPTWVEANGKRTFLAMDVNDGEATIRVPSSLLSASAYPAVLDPEIVGDGTAEVPVKGSLVPAPNVHDGAIGSNGTDLLVVWGDHRTTTDGLFAARVDPVTKKVGKQFMVSVADAGAGIFGAGSYLDVRVTAGKSSYLITWIDTTDFLNFPHIYGQRVRYSDDAVLDSLPIDFGQAPDSILGTFVARHRYGVAFGADAFMVTYDRPGIGEYDVFATAVEEASIPAATNTFLLNSASPSFQYPRVASDGERYFAIWQRNGDAPAIMGALFSKNGTVIAAPKELHSALSKKSITNLDITYSPGAGSFLVTADDNGNEAQILAASIVDGAGGKEIAANGALISNPSIRMLGVNPKGAGFSLLIGIPNDQKCIQEITAAGAPVGLCTNLMASDASDVAIVGSSIFTAALTPSSINPRLGNVISVKSGGNLATVTEVSNVTPSQTQIAGAYSSVSNSQGALRSAYLLAWREVTKDGPQLFGSCVPGGDVNALPSAPVILSNSAFTWREAMSMSVAPFRLGDNPSFLVAFGGQLNTGLQNPNEEVGGVFSTFVTCDETNTPTVSSVQLVHSVNIGFTTFSNDGFGASVSAYGDTAYVTWNEKVAANNNNDTAVRAIKMTGTSRSAPFDLGGVRRSNARFAPAIACEEKGCLVTWLEQVQLVPSGGAAFIAMGEEKASPNFLLYSPARASSGASVPLRTTVAARPAGDFAVAFQELGSASRTLDIGAVVIPGDQSKLLPGERGVKVGTEEVALLSVPGNVAALPSIAYFGDQASYLTAWGDRVVPPGRNRGTHQQISVNVFSADGRVLLPTPLVLDPSAVADPSNPSVRPSHTDWPVAIAGGPSRVMVAYQKLDLTSDAGNMRVRYRFIDGEKPAGTVCSTADECATRYCVSGLCANEPCNEGCGLNDRGICVPNAIGAPCGRDGAYACDGVQKNCPTACNGATAATACNANAQCSSTSEGAGVCVPMPKYCVNEHVASNLGQAIECGLFACEQDTSDPNYGSCRVDCVVSDDCSAGNVCNFDHRCVARPPLVNDEGCAMNAASTARTDRAMWLGSALALGLLVRRRPRRPNGGSQ